MRELEKYRRKDFGEVRLYLDDFYAIAGYVQKTCSDVEIRVGDLALDDLKEVEAVDEMVSSLRISGHDPSVTIDCDWRFSHIDVWGSGAGAVGAFEEVSGMMKKTQVRYLGVQPAVLYPAGLMLAWLISISLTAVKGAWWTLPASVAVLACVLVS